MIRTVGVAALILLGLLHAEDISVADRAAIAALRRVSGLPHALVMRRIAADGQLDLVVALASRQPPGHPWWSPRDRLGVLLQDKSDPNKVFPLTIEPGPNDDCSARIQRMTAQELVISCTGEKSQIYDSQNFVYDIRSRKLASHYSYPPFRTARVLQGRTGPQFVMADNHRLL